MGPSSDYARLLVDSLPSMLAYWGADLRCRFANRAYETWFGVDPDRLIGTSIAELLGPELFALNEPYIRGALRGQAQEFERTVPGPDGVQRASLALYLPHIVDGVVLGFFVQVTEVTRLKHAETALREAQRLGEVGSWVWDIGTDTVTWSDELFRIHGRDPRLPPPGFAGLHSLYTAESWSRLREAVESTLRTGAPYVIDVEYVRDDGSTGWLEARGEAVHDAAGRVARLAGTALEISTRRALARLELEAATAAGREKSRLLSRVSHELRTPLNGILGFAQLIQIDPSAGAKHQGWAGLIAHSGAHMLQLVDELLDLSAAELGQLKTVREPVDITRVVERSAATHAAQARQAGVTIATPGVAVATALAWGDGRKIDQIVDNVVSNAVKYNRPGGAVRLSVAHLGSTIELTVEDSGIGMTQAQLDGLYVPFERLGAERYRVEGTGLGLVVSRTLIELMGGSIRATSQAGVGTSVILDFQAAGA